jgi:membrane protein DedA with SNARE-associated domain
MLNPMELMNDSALAVIGERAYLTELLVFALGFAESIAFVSLFVPSSIIFLGVGAMHSAAGGAFWPVWLAGAAGACAGDCLSYALGRYFKHDVGRVWPFRKFPDLVPRGQILFERWGVLSIVIGKFVGGLRPFVPVAAGILSMPWTLFLFGSATSSLIWAGIFLAPGYGITFLLY